MQRRHEPCCRAAAQRREVPITIAGITDPDGDVPRLTITGIEQSEPAAGISRSRMRVDAMVRDGTPYVRAEVSGASTSRVYRIRYSAADRSGSCSGAVFVVVPGGQRNTAMQPVARWYDSMGSN